MIMYSLQFKCNSFLSMEGGGGGHTFGLGARVFKSTA